VGPDLPRLTVAVSTRGARALGLDPAAWPAEPGVDYLVLVQEADADPGIGPALDRLAARPDVTVLRLASTGLSRSRNAALDAAGGEILLVADDDVTHPPGATAGIRGFFAGNPGAALFVGRSLDPDGRPRKRPLPRRRLGRLNVARASSHEIALRLAPVRAAGVRFDEGFGVGAGTAASLGEEYVFLADCLAAGLEGVHDPLPVSVHPAESSGFVWRGADQARARALVFARVFGRAAPLLRLAFAAKNFRRFGSWRDALVFLRG
jgi:Glycosyl transferase family 2